MELIYKSAAAAVVAAILALLLRRREPEIALLIGICTVTVILSAAVRFAAGLRDLMQTIKTTFQVEERFTVPVLKCVVVALLSRYAADLCRDASQNGTASAVELAGAICAMSIAMPLIMSMLKMIGGLV